MANIGLVCWLADCHMFGRLYSSIGWVFAFVLSLPRPYIAIIYISIDRVGNHFHLHDGVASQS